MDIDLIRYFGASYIMESELLPKDKCNLIDYVREAEWDQILNLVFNGSKPTRKLTINEQYILEAQAENFIYPLIFRYMEEGNRKGRKKPTRAEKVAAASMKSKAGAGSPTASEVKKAPPKAKPKVPKAKPKIPKAKPKVPKPSGKKMGLGIGVDPSTGEAFVDTSKVATKTREYAKKGFEASRQAVTKHGPQVRRFARGTSGVVLVAAATAAGHRVYKSFLSNAARQCKGMSGNQKRDCMVRFRKAGYQAKLNSYVKAKNDCGNTKDPQRCQRDMNIKIKKAKYKMGTLYSRL